MVTIIIELCLQGNHFIHILMTLLPEKGNDDVVHKIHSQSMRFNIACPYVYIQTPQYAPMFLFVCHEKKR